MNSAPGVGGARGTDLDSAARREEIATALADRLHRDELLVIILGLAAVGIAIVFGIGTSRAITRPLAAFAVDMEAMGEGDLRLALDDHRGAAEFAKLADALRRARERLPGSRARPCYFGGNGMSAGCPTWATLSTHTL